MKNRKICCVFDNPNISIDAVRLRLKPYKEPYRVSGKERSIYKCEECGAYVLYDYEEVHCYWSGFNWDDLDIYHRFHPVYDVKDLADGETHFKYASDEGLTFFDHYYDK